MATSETNGRPADSPLRATRRAQQLRLVDVAESAGIAVSYLSMIERGLPASADVQGRIAAALNVDAATIFGVAS